MGTSDGYIAGVHKIVDHGPNSQRFNIVIMGDGYQSSELAKFATDVDSFVNTFKTTDPYPDLWCAFNVFRIDVVSTDSGADDPATCGDGSTGSGATPRTYFDSTFCTGGIRRALDCDRTNALNVSVTNVPEVHMTMVIVNTTEYGGTGGSLAIFSTAPSASEIGLHEMGHTAYGFADEYEYYAGCDSGETGHDSYSGSEPSEPNVTANDDPTTIKWKAQLTHAADGLPTTTNADCGQCDPQGNPKADSYVGAYDGARYFHCGIFRPQFTCRMRALGNPFCAVCQQVIRDTIGPFKPPESVTLTTPSISFTNIPEGLGGTGVTTYRAIVFDVVTCGTRTFHVTHGPTGGFGTPLGTSDQVTADDMDPIAEARIWLSYTSTTAGSSSNGTVTVHCDETNTDYVINIHANTVPRPKSAVSFVLDHSGSMADDAGGGTPKVAKLREAANIFVNAMLQGDGLAIVRFDDTAQVLMAVTDVGAPIIGAGRATATGIINGAQLDPAGNTSIGAGVVAAKGALDAAQAAASPHYDVTAMLVLTDGMENTAPMLASVGGSITANTFAVGLGLPENISVAALNTLTQGHNGYLLVTGALTPDQSARLDKYFLQILAGVTNANVVLDPPGVLTPGATHRIPFTVSEADFGVDVFLLTPLPKYVDFELETPDGSRLSPTTGLPDVEYVAVNEFVYYRLSLPAIPTDAAGSHAGTWYAHLSIRGQQPREGIEVGAVADGQLPYDLIVHCYSNLNFVALVRQSSFEPGATVYLTATLSEYDVPVDHRASVWAQVTRPDGTVFSQVLTENEPGRFASRFVASETGLYGIRVRAIGQTFAGTPFQREQALTAAVYPGGNTVNTGGGGSSSWCEIVDCLLTGKVFTPELRKRMEELGIDLAALLRCLAAGCRDNPIDERRRAGEVAHGKHES